MGRSLRLAIAVLLLAGASSLPAQTSQVTQVLDNSALRPPAGANVAIVEFDDLECPACARFNPVLKAAAERYKIPWIRHDLLIPYHPWSRSAAINARWFDAQGNGLGDAYRDAVFANQSSIYSVNMLDRFTQDFAHNHNVTLPFILDPQNKLAAVVDADNALGKRTGITHTPTIFIVTAHSKGAPFIEVGDPERDLYRAIDQALVDTKQTTAPAQRKAHK